MHRYQVLSSILLVSMASVACAAAGPSDQERPPAVDETAGAGGVEQTPEPVTNVAPVETPNLSVPVEQAGGAGAPALTPKPPPTLPADFTKTEHGGYKLGAAITEEVVTKLASEGAAPGACNSVIRGVLRDFKSKPEGGHADFQAGFWGAGATLHLVQPALGADNKPAYGAKCDTANFNEAECPFEWQMTTKSNFDLWYRTQDNINKPYMVEFFLEPNGDVFTFESKLFFPLDGAGWGESGLGEDQKMHNFHFTTEVHTQFLYKGGESFAFSGDDDLWVFINGKLALDLGGLHGDEDTALKLDAAKASELGLEKGKTYPLTLFHAERRTNGSHFRVDTNLEFTNCGTLPPAVVMPK